MGLAHSPKIATDGLVLCLDAGNPRSFSPNTFVKPLDIYTWYVTQRGNSGANGCTVQQDTSIDKSPARGIPLRMNVTGNDAHISSYNTSAWNIAPVLNGQTWRVSVYAKASTTLTNCEIYIFGADSTGTSFVGGNYIGITSKTITITPQWQRFDHFITFNNASVAYIQMRLDGPNADGAGTTVWWDGLQVELASAVTTFNPISNTNRASWFDLSLGGKNNTLTNYPAFSTANKNAISFNGTNNYTTSNIVLPAGHTNYTMSAWWYATVNNQIQTIYEQNTATVVNNRRSAILLLNSNWGFNGQGNDAHDKVPF